MGSQWSKVIILLILLACSAYFSATETAFSGANKNRLKTLADKQNRKAIRALKLLDNYDTLLSTILVGNNIVNIAASSISTLLFVELLHSQDLGATASTVVVTVVVLIFGEISPKSLAKESPEQFSMISAPIVSVLMKILTPINFLFAQWKKLLRRVIRVSSDDTVTDDELLNIIDEAEQGGGIGENESELLRNVIAFEDREAGEIVTPRVDVVAVDWEDSKEKIAETFATTGYSRLPVCREDIDHMEGVIHMKDFYAEVYGKETELSFIVKPIVIVPENVKISKLLKLLQKEKGHMAAIADEYGGIVGIVTMEDILEELVGEIWDEHDEIVEAFAQLTEDSYKVLCSTDLGKMFRFFNIKKERTTAGVGGWVMEQLGKMPEVGDRFSFENLNITVTETEGNRAVAITVHVLPTEEEQEDED